MLYPTDVIALVLSIIGVATIPLYISLLRLLIAERSLNFAGSFYDLFLVVALLDISATIVNFLGVSFSGWGITTSLTETFGLWYGRFYLALAWFTRVNQGTSSALVAVNRAYAMIIPLKYAKIWRRSRVRWLQLLQITPGFLFAIVIMTFDVTFTSFPENTLRKTTVRIISDSSRTLLYNGAGFLEIILVATILISYGSGIVSLVREERRRPAYSYSSRRSRAERSATHLGISICLLELIYFGYSIFSLLFTIPASTYFSIHSIMTDLYSSLNCYLLIAFSSSVRQRLWKMFGVYKPVVEPVTISGRQPSSTISPVA